MCWPRFSASHKTTERLSDRGSLPTHMALVSIWTEISGPSCILRWAINIKQEVEQFGKTKKDEMLHKYTKNITQNKNYQKEKPWNLICRPELVASVFQVKQFHYYWTLACLQSYCSIYEMNCLSGSSGIFPPGQHFLWTVSFSTTAIYPFKLSCWNVSPALPKQALFFCEIFWY